VGMTIGGKGNTTKRTLSVTSERCAYLGKDYNEKGSDVSWFSAGCIFTAKSVAVSLHLVLFSPLQQAAFCIVYSTFVQTEGSFASSLPVFKTENEGRCLINAALRLTYSYCRLGC